MFSGSCGKKKIKVAFLNVFGKGWLGGFYYLKNLLYTISILDDCRIQPVVLVNEKSDEELVKQIEPYAEIIRTNLVLQNHSSNQIRRFLYPYQLWIFLKLHGVNVVSHSNFTNPHVPLKKINWIPDFQHLHLPELFSEKEINFRNNLFNHIIQYSDSVLFSSNDALEDMKAVYKDEEKNCTVLKFVSPVRHESSENIEEARDKLLEKYDIPELFFYVPNQFWQHKNHILIFKALKILKKSGINVQVVCTGECSDYRHKSYYGRLLSYLSENEVEENVKLLGLVDRTDVIKLVRFSLAVINPSLFEGWSTTVEEVKSLGQRIILSDIKVHREQNPGEAFFFDPHNEDELASILAYLWQKNEPGPHQQLEQRASVALSERLQQFGSHYQSVVLAVCGVRD